MKEKKLPQPSPEGGIDRELFIRSRMEIMCHQMEVGREVGAAPHEPLPPV